MKTFRTSLAAALVFLLACGDRSAPPKEAPRGGIDQVVVVLKGHDEPLPFDPRGGRLTIVTREIERLVGHPIVFELDTALSPELKSSLEESVLASFETLTRELVLLQRDDPETFAKARKIERVAFVYDAVARESEGKLRDDGMVLDVRSPPDRFPLFEQWLVTSAVYQAFVADLDERWGEAEPTRLSPRDQALWFDYMTRTRPGAGYLWTAARAKRPGASWASLRAEHLERILKLAGAVDAKSALGRKVRRFLLENAAYAAELGEERASGAYERWLKQSAAAFDEDEQQRLAHVLFDRSRPRVAFPSFDRVAFGLSVFDGWVKDGARVELPATARGKLQKDVLCPVRVRPLEDADDMREIHYGCSGFFAFALEDAVARTALVDAIARRRDPRLLELAIMNVGTKSAERAVALVDTMQERVLFDHGAHVLFHQHARRDDVRRALEDAAPRWWRAGRPSFALLVMGRRWEALDVHYADDQATRFAVEFGGPVQPPLLGAFLDEDLRAIEMTPKLWLALARTPERDALVAKALPRLLAQDREARTARARPVLVLLRKRLCDEKNAAGLSTIRAALERWRGDHPDDAAAVSNALHDFSLGRCVKPSEKAND